MLEPLSRLKEPADLPSREDAEAAVRILLRHCGEDVTRPGLLDTPRRVVAALLEFTSGHRKDTEFSFTTFDSEGVDEMVIVDNVPFSSTCEHHLLPFSGEATVAYLPKNRIVGLSKIPRTVERFARRLQNQERITQQVADFIGDNLCTESVAVVLRARHSCMECRGARSAGAVTTTASLRGAFKTSELTRAEFFAQIRPLLT